MVETPAPQHARHDPGQRLVELRREGYTMALYVAICLLAAGVTAPEDTHHHVVGFVWGITLGLALAHWFAFRLSTRLVAGGEVGRSDIELAAAQLAGAAAVAVLASVPVLVFPDSLEFEAAGLVLALFVAVVAFVAKRGGGATLARAVLYSGLVLVVALAVVEIKIRLAGH